MVSSAPARYIIVPMPNPRNLEGLDSLLVEASFNCEVAMKSYVRDRWVPTPHITQCDKLYVVHSGKGVARLNEAEYRLQAGDVYLVPSGTLQQGDTDAADPIFKTWVHFESTTTRTLKLLNLYPPPVCLRGPSAQTIAEFAAELLEESKSERPARQLAVKSLLMRVLLTAYRAPDSDIRPADGACKIAKSMAANEGSGAQRIAVDRIRKVLALITEQYASPLSLAQLAECAHLHPAYFTKVFKRMVGMPPIKYLEQQRVRRSQDFLSRTDIPVNEVAQRVGYPDPYHFSRAFRRLTGRSPSLFRLEANRAREE
jgi:AraC family transcriptional regulator of arabinose operon